MNSFCNAGEVDWGEAEDCDVQEVSTLLKRDIIKRIGISDLVTEGESAVFLCDGENGAEAEGRGTPTGPELLDFWRGYCDRAHDVGCSIR